ncbi:phenylacetate--CoA ligase [Aequorivita sp. 609]|uniref:phenylacetate--CoA ligase family protein n=1 Tax=Aequorivita TaxID=153265 RepID=UPI00161A1349|nr:MULTISPECIES: phenylacetate--CoA ligase [Aequorivita]MBB6682530.1 phenylacetate--CoA ligase [Aequorivita sp. 609]
MYNKEIETLPLEKLRKLQSERLVNLVNRVYKTVPFYKNLFDESGIDVSSIKSINDIHKLPFTKKTDLRDQYPFGFLTVPENQLARIHCSSGTTGKPTVVAYTKNDLDIFSEVVARSLAAGGAKPGMKMHNSYGYGLFTGGIGIHYGAEKLGMSVVPVSVGMTDRQITLLQDFQPEVICCTPSYAQTIAFELEKRNLKISDLNLKYAILGAEPWTEAIRSDIEASLGVKATNIYGLSEIIGPGVSQEAYNEQGTGSYVWEDHFFPEIVDKDTGEPLPYGEEGVLVFTTLTKEAMPFLRYWTNDICSLSYDHSTSRTHIKMGQIKGRSDDMLIIRGVNLFHTQIEEIFKEYKELTPNYQLIVTKNGLADQVEVKVETNSDFQIKLGLESGFKEDEVLRNSALASMSNQLKKNIKDKVGLSIKVTLNCYGAIPKSEGGKLNRIIDLRNS